MDLGHLCSLLLQLMKMGQKMMRRTQKTKRRTQKTMKKMQSMVELDEMNRVDERACPKRRD